jgi:23S rRNA pseudouridine1911/1915/1917 synthase
MKEKKQVIMVDKENTLLDSLVFFKKDISRNDLKNYLKYEMVMVNGKVITRATEKVYFGDEITIYYQKKRIPEFDLKILYEDKDIIAISKPSGLLSISNDKEKEVTAFRMVREYVRKNNPHTYLFAIHRLDQDTSGVLMFGKNEKIKDELQSNWNEIVKKRGYYAVIEGNFSGKSGTFRSYLKENKLGFIYSTRDKSGKYAVTNYKEIGSNGRYSLMDVDIETGRRNQIRVHFSESGHPILGDKKYGSRVNPLGRLALHSYELSFIDPRNGKMITIRDDMPEEFRKVIKKEKN